MRSKLALALLAFQLQGAWRVALPGYKYEFPRDHFNHQDFQTEWWYYTGNLRSADGHRFGFELTFFRQGVDRETEPAKAWDVRDVWMAHLALSDIDGRRFFHTERLNRAGAGIAGADLEKARVWNGNWEAAWALGTGTQSLRAIADRFSFDLSVKSEKPPVINGKNGISEKAVGEGRASHYISLTRLSTHGVVVVEGTSFKVEGLSWMDHEFFTHQLDPAQSGWDWFSLQFDDGSEAMLFQLRRKDGSRDPYSAGTYVDRSGHAQHLTSEDFALASGKTWTSPQTGGNYPVEWTIRIPRLGIDAVIGTALPQQEMTGITNYWEGAISVSGTRKGVGYLEMTGYAGKSPSQ
jgi:predicted secreted hydrolase